MRRATLLTAAAACLMAGAALAAPPPGPAADAYPPGTVPPTSAYRGGAGAPFSPHASNTGAHNSRSIVAPRLPNPDAASNTPEALLHAAQQALNRRQTGAAQQALEMAETRVLSRTIDPAAANQPDPAQMVRHISAARQALGGGNIPAAQSEIAAALAAPVPPPGPAVTIGPPVPIGPPTLVYPPRAY